MGEIQTLDAACSIAVRRTSFTRPAVSAFAFACIATPLARLTNSSAGSTVLVVVFYASMPAAEFSTFARMLIVAFDTSIFDAVAIIAGIVVSAFAGGAIATALARLANSSAGSTVLVVVFYASMPAAEFSAVAVLCIAAGLTFTIDAVTFGTRSAGLSANALTRFIAGIGEIGVALTGIQTLDAAVCSTVGR